jgi:hypothetical protein
LAVASEPYIFWRGDEVGGQASYVCGVRLRD